MFTQSLSYVIKPFNLVTPLIQSKFCGPLNSGQIEGSLPPFFPLFHSLYFLLVLHYMNAWNRLDQRGFTIPSLGHQQSGVVNIDQCEQNKVNLISTFKVATLIYFSPECLCFLVNKYCCTHFYKNHSK